MSHLLAEWQKKESYSMNLLIREYRGSDYVQVTENLKAAEMFKREVETAEVFAAKIKHAPNSILVAEMDGKVIGNIFIIFDKLQSFIYRFAVREEYRKQGIGTQLLKKAEDLLREFGAARVSGTIRENHPELEKYYTELGYDLAPIKHRYIHKKLQ